jgi:hypothetical protein
MATFHHLTAVIGAAAVASTLGIAALLGAGAAGATSTDDMFMDVLAEQGIFPPATAVAVSTAYDACAVFEDGGGLYDAVNYISANTDLNTDDSAFFVGASVATYCPEHEAALG